MPFSGDGRAGAQGVWAKGARGQVPNTTSYPDQRVDSESQLDPRVVVRLCGEALGLGLCLGLSYNKPTCGTNFGSLTARATHAQARDRFGSLRISWFGRNPLLPVASLGPQIPQTQQGLPHLDGAPLPPSGPKSLPA